MKYWVRAVGTTINEQLLVSAETQQQLQVELSNLLQIKVLAITLSTQRIQQILTAEDRSTLITTVEIETEIDRLEKQFCGPGAAATSQQKQAENHQQHQPGGIGGADPTGQHQQQVVAEESVAGHAPTRGGVNLELSLGENATAATMASFGFFVSEESRNSMVFNPTANNVGVGGPQGESPTSTAMLKKIVLSRERVSRLLDPNYSNAFYPTVKGCLVRLRTKQGNGYMIATIANVESPNQLLIDFAYYLEIRHTDSVSNGKPKHDELREWFKLHMRPHEAHHANPSSAGSGDRGDHHDDGAFTGVGAGGAASPIPPPLLLPEDIESKTEMIADAEAQIKRVEELRAPPPPPPPAQEQEAGTSPRRHTLLGKEKKMLPQGGGNSQKGNSPKSESFTFGVAPDPDINTTNNYSSSREVGACPAPAMAPAAVASGDMPPMTTGVTPGRLRRRSSLTALGDRVNSSGGPSGSFEVLESQQHHQQQIIISNSPHSSSNSQAASPSAGGGDSEAPPSGGQPRRRRSSLGGAEDSTGSGRPPRDSSTSPHQAQQQQQSPARELGGGSSGGGLQRKSTGQNLRAMRSNSDLSAGADISGAGDSTGSNPRQRLRRNSSTSPQQSPQQSQLVAHEGGSSGGGGLQRKSTGQNLRAMRSNSDLSAGRADRQSSGDVQPTQPLFTQASTSQHHGGSFHHLGEAKMAASGGGGGIPGAGASISDRETLVENRLVPTTVTGSHKFTTHGADLLLDHRILISCSSGGGTSNAEANEIGNFLYAQRTSSVATDLALPVATRVRLPPSFSSRAAASSALIQALGPESMDVTRRGFVTHGAPVKWRGFFWLLATVKGLPGRFFLLGSDALCSHFGTQVKPIEIQLPSSVATTAWMNAHESSSSSDFDDDEVDEGEGGDGAGGGKGKSKPRPRPEEEVGAWCQLVASDHHHTNHKGLYLLWSTGPLHDRNGKGRRVGIAVARTKADHLTGTSQWDLVTSSDGPLATVELFKTSSSSTPTRATDGSVSFSCRCFPHLQFVEHFVVGEKEESKGSDGSKASQGWAKLRHSVVGEKASNNNNNNGTAQTTAVEFLSIQDPKQSGWLMAKADAADISTSSSTASDVSGSLLYFLPYSALLSHHSSSPSPTRQSGDSPPRGGDWEPAGASGIRNSVSSHFKWQPLMLPLGTVSLGGGAATEEMQQVSLCHAGHHILLFRMFVQPCTSTATADQLRNGGSAHSITSFKYNLVWLIL